MTNPELYKEALEVFGKTNQILMLFEEIGELQQAINKRLRGIDTDLTNLKEEIADVEIMLEQMRIIFGIDELSYSFTKANKLIRLESYVEQKKLEEHQYWIDKKEDLDEDELCED
jgi:NTP pyrophosphatase (non-canonical NTP hydrolase)